MIMKRRRLLHKFGVDMLSAILLFATTSLSLATPVNVEIQPALHWVVTDDTTRTDNFVYYSPFVCSQGAFFIIDISEHGSFDNPASRNVLEAAGRLD